MRAASGLFPLVFHVEQPEPDGHRHSPDDRRHPRASGPRFGAPMRPPRGVSARSIHPL